MNELIDILDNQNASLVIRDAQGAIHTLHGRGVSDLHNILHNMPQWLNGAMVADKVVGRGAAALMILGGVKQLHTVLISEPAIEFLEKAHVKFSYGKRVPAIVNQAGTGFCPVETLTANCTSPQESLPLIDQFVSSLKSSSC